jgi:hypothetical protein
MAAVDSTTVAPAPARAPRVRARPAAVPSRASRRRARGFHVTGGILWISALALLLAGVVAVNVAVLRVNMGVTRLEKEQLQLQAQNAALASQASRAKAAPLIEQAARRLGLVPAPATDTRYIDLGRR